MKEWISPSPDENLRGYDVRMDEVCLVHKNCYDRQSYDPVYKNGRLYDGLVFCIEGQAFYRFENETLSVKKGDVLFLPSATHYVVVTENEPFRHYTVNFRLVPDVEQNGSLYPILSGNRPILLSCENVGIYEAAFARLLAVWRGKQYGFKLSAKALTELLLCDFFADRRKSRLDPHAYSRVFGAKKYIDEHVSEPIRLSELACLCDLSETHFRRLFGEVFELSPTEYQINLRLLKAKDLLSVKTYSIAEVAELCGFSDANYFSRLFKTRVGISPLRYKQTH